MSVQVHRLSDGAFLASEGGAWIEGRYVSESTARKAASMDPSRLHDIWRAKLAEAGPDAALTDEDLS